jgi:tRNA(Ile)-lysidine synthase
VAARLTGIQSLYPDVRPEKTAVIGVSGGRDSIALAHLLISMRWKKLVVAHLNHGLRGRASEEDAAFVRQFAKDHGVRCAIGKVNVAALAKRKKLSVETAARDARRDFLLRLAGKHRCGAVFMAHHAEDQAETVLQNLFRGAALRGVSGMAPAAWLGESVLLLRPALDASRREVDEYMAAHGLQHREDESNAFLEFTRNRVRHELLPLLDDIFRREVSPLITRFAEHARQDDEFLQTLVNRCSTDPNVVEPDGSLRITGKFRRQHPAVQGRILRNWLVGRSSRIGSREVHAAQAMLEGRKAGRINLPGDAWLCHDGRRLWLEPSEKSTRRKSKSPRPSKRC